MEGFFDCMKVDQAGFSSVALMGLSLSEVQEELLVAKFERVVLMLDGDGPGRQATAECHISPGAEDLGAGGYSARGQAA